MFEKNFSEFQCLPSSSLRDSLHNKYMQFSILVSATWCITIESSYQVAGKSANIYSETFSQHDNQLTMIWEYHNAIEFLCSMRKPVKVINMSSSFEIYHHSQRMRSSSTVLINEWFLIVEHQILVLLPESIKWNISSFLASSIPFLVINASLLLRSVFFNVSCAILTLFYILLLSHLSASAFSGWMIAATIIEKTQKNRKFIGYVCNLYGFHCLLAIAPIKFYRMSHRNSSLQ